MLLNEKLKLYRKTKKLTQKELAKQLGVSEISIRKYESGERVPSNAVLLTISAALDIPIDDLSNTETNTQLKLLTKWSNNYHVSKEDVDEWGCFVKLLETHGYTLFHGNSSNGKSNCLDINGVSFIDDEIETFKTKVFEYIDFLISNQSNKNKEGE